MPRPFGRTLQTQELSHSRPAAIRAELLERIKKILRKQRKLEWGAPGRLCDQPLSCAILQLRRFYEPTVMSGRDGPVMRDGNCGSAEQHAGRVLHQARHWAGRAE